MTPADTLVAAALAMTLTAGLAVLARAALDAHRRGIERVRRDQLRTLAAPQVLWGRRYLPGTDTLCRHRVPLVDYCPACRVRV